MTENLNLLRLPVLKNGELTFFEIIQKLSLFVRHRGVQHDQPGIGAELGEQNSQRDGKQ